MHVAGCPTSRSEMRFYDYDADGDDPYKRESILGKRVLTSLGSGRQSNQSARKTHRGYRQLPHAVPARRGIYPESNFTGGVESPENGDLGI
jgi:hypothetical protein